MGGARYARPVSRKSRTATGVCGDPAINLEFRSPTSQRGAAVSPRPCGKALAVMAPFPEGEMPQARVGGAYAVTEISGLIA